MDKNEVFEGTKNEDYFRGFYNGVVAVLINLEAIKIESIKRNNEVLAIMFEKLIEFISKKHKIEHEIKMLEDD